MQIGIDIRSLLSHERTGVAEYTFGLLAALFARDDINTYILFSNARGSVADVLPARSFSNVQYIHTRYPNKIFHLSTALFRQPKIDRLITHQQKKDIPIDIFFSPNLNFTAISPKVKHVLTIHDLSFEYFPDCYTPKQRLWHSLLQPKKQCHEAAIIFTPSQNTKRDVVEYYQISEARVHVLPPGLSSSMQAFGMSSPEDVQKKYQLPKNFILFVGTIEPRKNIVALLEGFAQAKKQYPNLFDDCACVIAGAKGWKNTSILSRMRQSPDIRFLGYVDSQEKAALYALARVFVYPSLYEGFGFPVLEAMASGTPVITSARSSLPEVAGDAAYFVNPMNSEEITRGLARLFQERAWASALGIKGKQRAQEFTWQKTAQQFLGHIARLKERV